MDGPGGARRSRDKQLPLACQGVPLSPVNLNVCVEYNPNLTTAGFTSVMGCNRSGLGWEAAPQEDCAAFSRTVWGLKTLLA